MNPDFVDLESLTLLGISTRASNAEAERLGAHWQRFLADGVKDRIPERLDDSIVALYCEYEGDYSQPYTFFLGCSVRWDAKTPEGFERRVITAGRYARWTAEGEQPDALIRTWQSIWQAPIARRYDTDYEVHDPARSRCVEINVGVHPERRTVPPGPTSR